MADVRDVTYDLLRSHDLTTIFGNPGSNELPFLAGMPEDFRYVLGLHEGAVLAMADGYALARGSSALVNLHAAAGTGNALGALTNSVYSHSPLIITAGQQVRSTIGQEVMLANVDAAELPKPLVKWSCEPSCAQDVPRSISHAIHIANLPAKGPVYVSVPYDDWAQEAPEGAQHLLERKTASAGALSEAQLAELAEALDGAQHPVLVLGPEVDAEHANDDAVRLADRLGAPVWIAPSASRCPFPTRHRSFRGVLPAAVQGITDALREHDLILVVGAPVFRYHQFVPGEYLPAGARLVQLTSDPGEAARAPMGEALVGDVKDALSRLAGAVTPGLRPELPPLPERPAARTAGERLHPEELFALLREHAPEDAVYVKESTATTGAFWAQMDLSTQGSYFFPASGGLGFGLPAAVGAQLAHDERQVIGLIGDGSANYGITALWTAARYRIPVIVIILKNGTYGALRWFSKVLDAGEVPGMDVPGIDFAQIARGYGVDATSVRTGAEFTAALKSALGAGKPVLIEAETELTEP
ncbi:benzoylformate decarboxylase [Saccharopolyspora sp. WRP15-2]|uniref:Benzoylformate decarboxylase n=1 Tax=Saccharopolyspora oryzae TaxID=2997343 RepID=A0ABT4V1C2_9PSEU|nr:benzoylformate decarboxylase [Saccharopolyspora oryzae]MDA3627733.1 benzoylformate decarboxylase [Saccharopolyspora oryzae]